MTPKNSGLAETLVFYFYTICAVVLVFITQNRMEEKERTFFSTSISMFLAEKSAFFRVLYKNGKKLSP